MYYHDLDNCFFFFFYSKKEGIIFFFKQNSNDKLNICIKNINVKEKDFKNINYLFEFSKTVKLTIDNIMML